MTEPLSEQNLIRALLEHIPDLLPNLYDDIETVSASDLHVAIGVGFVQEFLLPLMDSPKNEIDSRLIDSFDFIERMASSRNPSLRSIVEVSICESLGDSPRHLALARGVMGPETTAISEQVERTLGRNLGNG